MEFSFETNYDHKALINMIKALRKTIRKRRSLRTRICAILVVLLGVYLSLPEIMTRRVTTSFVVTWVVILIMIIVVMFDDHINAWISQKRMIEGMYEASSTFKDDSYLVKTNVGKTEFFYTNIRVICDTGDYIVFIFDKCHGQVLNKKGITNGTIEDFEKFIEGKTNLKIKKIK